MRAKYLRDNSFSHEIYTNDLPIGSKIWINIVKSLKLLEMVVRWVVRDGNTIRFLEDNWLWGSPIIHT